MILTQKLIKKTYCLMLLSTVIIALSACVNTISVSQKPISTQLLNGRANIITNNMLSMNSKGRLLSAGLSQEECFDYFSHCLIQLSESQFNAHSPRQLAIFAELHYAKSLQLKNSRECKQGNDTCVTAFHAELFSAIKYSYAYLFRANLVDFSSELQNSLPNELDIQTQDIYDVASNQLITTLYNKGSVELESSNLESDYTRNSFKQTLLSTDLTHDEKLINMLEKPQVHIMTAHIANAAVDIFLPNESAYLNNSRTNKTTLSKSIASIENLIPTSNLSLSGLNSISKRTGFGISYIAQQRNRDTQTLTQLLAKNKNETVSTNLLSNPSNRIFQNGNLLMTAILQPIGNTIEKVLTTNQYELHLYNPHQQSSIEILGKKYPLAGNFSSGYAMWLAENNFSGVSYLNMLQKNEELPLPRLYMLEPFNKKKHVIIMLHGLASSPETWVGVTNDIMNDEVLRENFQLWQIAYSTNLPILENRYHINQLIRAAYNQIDDESQISMGHHGVLIGHSMGSVISRLLLSNNDLTQNFHNLTNNQELPSNIEQKTLSQNLARSYTSAELAPRFKLQSIPEISTAVFISAPFRGTNFADRWFTKALREVIQLPKALTLSEELTELNKNPLAALFLENGASQLSDQSSFINLTKDVSITRNVTYHSILGNYKGKGILQSINKDTSLQNNSDGIVPYSSSHLEGASSEIVLEGGHDIHTNPKTVTELRKILYSHLVKYPIK